MIKKSLLLIILFLVNLKLAFATNTLVIIADDLGIGELSCYGANNDTAHTPNIDKLCERGIKFTNVWSYPTCSPARASILTGRYGFRTGVMAPCGGPNPGLPLSEVTLAEILQKNNIKTAAIGKWHLSDRNNGGKLNPNKSGFDHYSGMYKGVTPSYFKWQKTVNGVSRTSKNYITTEFTDDAINWLMFQNKPWFLWLAYVAPHSPFHLPPSNMHSQSNLSEDPQDIENYPRPYYKAMIESMDYEIGRIFKYLGSNLEKTNIIFIGDNGTPGQVIKAPYNRKKAKLSLYQGGIHVPMIISGPIVKGNSRTETALVNTTDLFSTILGMYNIAAPKNIQTDSISLIPYLKGERTTKLRKWAYSEQFFANYKRLNGKTIRNHSYKLIEKETGKEELYNLIKDPYEKNNLLTKDLDFKSRQNYDELKKLISQLGK